MPKSRWKVLFDQSEVGESYGNFLVFIWAVMQSNTDLCAHTEESDKVTIYLSDIQSEYELYRQSSRGYSGMLAECFHTEVLDMYYVTEFSWVKNLQGAGTGDVVISLYL